MSAIVEFIRSLFQAPVPAVARSSSQADLWALYKLSRGRDTLTEADLRRLAEAADK